MWHPYKYSVEITYKAFAPIIKFLEQGWDLKAGDVVPMKVKLRHMEKTIVGLFLAPQLLTKHGLIVLPGSL